MTSRKYTFWYDAEVETLKSMWKRGKSAGQIAMILGRTRGGVAGKFKRLGLREHQRAKHPAMNRAPVSP